MAILSKEQLDKIREIIQRHVNWFIWKLFGSSYANSSPSSVDVPKNIMDQLPSSLTKISFVLGREEATMKETEWKAYTWDNLAQAAAKKLTPVETLQVKAAELSAYSKYRSLGEDIINGLYNQLAVATNQSVSEGQVRGTIRDKIKFGVETNRKYSDVANDLVASLKENKRNWARVASTEMHQARQTGIAHAIINKIDIYGDGEGEDSFVTIILAPDACGDCVRLYVDKKTGHPKIFKLSELLGNAGTNYQRPWRINARAVVPPLHPHCLLPGQLITTIRGRICVEDILPGEYVLSASGEWRRVTQTHRFLYSGTVVKFTTSDYPDLVISVTEDHPFSRPSGSWFDAKEFKEGTEIRKVVLSKSYNGPVLAFEEVRFAKILFCFSRSGVPVSAIDLDGDLFFPVCEVNKVTANDHVGKYGNTSLFEQNGGFFLQRGEESPLPVFLEPFNDAVFRLFDPSSGCMGSSNPLSALLGGCELEAELKRFGERARADFSLFESLDDGCTRHPELAGYFIYGQTNLYMQPDNFVYVEFDPFRHKPTVTDAIVTVNSVEKIQFTGWVHNLSVEQDESFLIHDLASHNCYCRLRYVPAGWGWNKEGRFTLIDPKSAFPKVFKSESLSKGVDLNAHSLLHASNATLPTVEYINQISDPVELEHLERRLKKLEQLYVQDEKIHERVEGLLHRVRGRHFQMYMEGQVVSPEESGNE